MQKSTTTLMIALLGALTLLNPVQAGGAPQTQSDSTLTSPRRPALRVGMYRSIHTLTMNVLVEKPPGDKVSVTLLDKKGSVLYKGSLSKRQSNHWLKLDFADMQDDTFSVVVTNGTDRISKSIHLSTQKLYEMPARTLLVMN